MNALLKTVSENAAEDLKRLIEEGAEDILKAIHKMEEQAQLDDAKPKFALGYKITLDLDKGEYDCALSWSLKQTLSTSHQIEDENQGTLAAVDDFVKTCKKSGGSVTIKTGKSEVTIGADSNFKRKNN